MTVEKKAPQALLVALHRGRIRGVTPQGDVHYWLERIDGDGADIFWIGETRGAAVAIALELARGGICIVDRTEGPR